MKKTLTLTLAAMMAAGSLYARTWTSAEGGKTFTGDYVSHTDDSVTVTKGFKKVTFKISMLSEADRKWLTEQKPEASEKEEVKSDTDAGKIGDKLKGKLSKFDGRKYSSTELTKTPEYYLVYFSASW